VLIDDITDRYFASTEGNRGGEFFTPQSIVRLLVEMLAPRQGVVFDPAAGRAACLSKARSLLPLTGTITRRKVTVTAMASAQSCRFDFHLWTGVKPDNLAVV
jgi:hypothetical protein